MSFRKDLTGKRFGMLSVIGFDTTREGYSYFWDCICDCGKNASIRRSNLTSGNSTNCGCSRYPGHPTHGMSNGKHPLYSKWSSMHQRCKNPNTESYPLYGGRGITVCERWNIFENFRDDMLPTWKKGLTLERMDVNGNYEPSNCKWASVQAQSRNRRSNHLLTYNGQTKTLIEWSEETGIPYKTIAQRCYYGWTDERAVTTPVRGH